MCVDKELASDADSTRIQSEAATKLDNVGVNAVHVDVMASELPSRRCVSRGIWRALLGGLIMVFATSTVLLAQHVAWRRAIKIVAYHLDCRYWPDWYAILLWIGAVGALNVLMLRLRLGRKVTSRALSRETLDYKRRFRNKLHVVYVLGGYVALIAAVLFYQLVDVQPMWRFLKYKIYGEYIRIPILEFVEEGRFSKKLLLELFVIIVVLVTYITRKMRNNRNLALLCPLFLFSQSLFANESVELAPSQLHLLQQATYSGVSDLEKIAGAPSVQNSDGGYDVDGSILQCFAVMSYFYTGGRYDNEAIRFRMRFPLNEEAGHKYPLIVWLHGYGESTGDNQRHLAHLHHAIKSFIGEDALDFYMIAVQCPPDNATWEASISSTGQGDARLTIVGEIMEAVVKEYPVDEKRIGVIGISSGASASWKFVERYAGRISGLAAFSGTPSLELAPEKFLKTSIWAFNNTGDVGASWKDTASFIDKINSLGGNGYVTLQNHGLHDSWSFPLKNDDVIGWLISQTLDGKGRLQGASYPKRSFFTIFLLFILPITIMVASSLIVIKRSVNERQADLDISCRKGDRVDVDMNAL